jgi:hypothetical protein
MTDGAGHDRYDTIDACAYPDAFSLLRSTCIVQHFVSFRADADADAEQSRKISDAQGFV